MAVEADGEKINKLEKTSILIAIVLVLVAAFLTVSAKIVSAKTNVIIASVIPSIVSTGKLEGQININIAGADELSTLPGIGPELAKSIINYRREYGPFKHIAGIIDVSGIGLNTFENIKDMITVS